MIVLLTPWCYSCGLISKNTCFLNENVELERIKRLFNVNLDAQVIYLDFHSDPVGYRPDDITCNNVNYPDTCIIHF